MQDEIVSRLANRLGQELAAAEARARRALGEPGFDGPLFPWACGFFNKGDTADLLDKARSHFDRALDLDPDNVDALVGRAWVDVSFVANWLSEDRVKRLRSAEADLGKALRLRPENPHARALLGMVRMYSNRALQGIAECERALAIDRNLAAAHAWIGLGKHFAGRDEETEAHVLEALRISPRDTRASVWMLIVGFARLHSSRDEEAVAWLNRSIELNPNNPVVHFSLAAALGASRPYRRGARSRAGWARTRSELLQRAASSIHDLQRQSRLSRPPRATVRGHAHGGAAGGRMKAALRERVRCSSLVDWPVYPRLRRIMQGSEWAAQFGAPCGCAA